MSDPYAIRLTQGHVLRHAPAQSPQGRDAAVIDIAQDLLLRQLAEVGVLSLVAFKGGTALRKVYAGAADGSRPTLISQLLPSTTIPPRSFIRRRRGRIEECNAMIAVLDIPPPGDPGSRWRSIRAHLRSCL